MRMTVRNTEKLISNLIEIWAEQNNCTATSIKVWRNNEEANNTDSVGSRDNIA